jgi:hypothetical protein
MLIRIDGGEAVIAAGNDATIKVVESSPADDVHFIVGPGSMLSADKCAARCTFAAYDPRGWFVRMILSGVRDWYRQRRRRMPRGSALVVLSPGAVAEFGKGTSGIKPIPAPPSSPCRRRRGGGRAGTSR